MFSHHVDGCRASWSGVWSRELQLGERQNLVRCFSSMCRWLRHWGPEGLMTLWLRGTLTTPLVLYFCLFRAVVFDSDRFEAEGVASARILCCACRLVAVETRLRDSACVRDSKTDFRWGLIPGCRIGLLCCIIGSVVDCIPSSVWPCFRYFAYLLRALIDGRAQALVTIWGAGYLYDRVFGEMFLSV